MTKRNFPSLAKRVELKIWLDTNTERLHRKSRPLIARLAGKELNAKFTERNISNMIRSFNIPIEPAFVPSSKAVRPSAKAKQEVQAKSAQALVPEQYAALVQKIDQIIEMQRRNTVDNRVIAGALVGFLEHMGESIPEPLRNLSMGYPTEQLDLFGGNA